MARVLMDSMVLKTLELLLCNILIVLPEACSLICKLISLFLYPVCRRALEKEEVRCHRETEEEDLT